MALSKRACPSTGAFLNGRRASTAGFRTLGEREELRMIELCKVLNGTADEKWERLKDMLLRIAAQRKYVPLVKKK